MVKVETKFVEGEALREGGHVLDGTLNGGIPFSKRV
jgi:hypothetical protein